MARKTLFLLVILTILFSFSFAEISIMVDDNYLDLDVPPRMIDGRTMVPMRAIFEALGVNPIWDGPNNAVKADNGGLSLILPIGSRQATLNGRAVTLDVPARLLEGRTMVPTRFIAESLGANVNWEGSSQTVIIKKSSTPGSENNPLQKDMLVHFIDVGQGDATLFELPNGKIMLVDAGPRSAGEKVVSYLKAAGISTIDKLVLTHPHEDHLGGMLYVLDSFDVESVVDSGYPHTTNIYEDFLTKVDSQDIDYAVAHRGNSINLDPSVNIDILHPGTTMGDPNNNSVILEVSYGDMDVILSGDAEKEAEEMMLDFASSLNHIEIMKVGHHGSTTSTHPAYALAVKPEVAVISVGSENDYGHPDNIIINRLTSLGAKVYRTDVSGDIVVKMSKNSYSLNEDHLPTSANHIVEVKEEKTTVPPANDTPTVQDDGSGVVIHSLNKDAEYIVIKNTSPYDVNMGNWMILSEKGMQSFIFPSSYILRAGKEVKITSGAAAGTGDFTFADGHIWNNSSQDPAVLYNSVHIQVDRMVK